MNRHDHPALLVDIAPFPLDFYRSTSVRERKNVVVFGFDHYVSRLVHESHSSVHTNGNKTIRKIYAAGSLMNRPQDEASVPPYIPDFFSDIHSRQIFTEIESAIELGRHSVSFWIDEEK